MAYSQFKITTHYFSSAFDFGNRRADRIGLRKDERRAADGQENRMIALGKVQPDFVVAVGRDGHQTARLVFQLERRAENDAARGEICQSGLPDRLPIEN